jgi:hypothetical protein
MGGRMQQSFVVRAKATMLRVHPHPVNNFKRTTHDQGRSSRQHITWNKCRWLSQRVARHCLFCIFVKPFKRGEGKAGLQSNCRTIFHFFCCLNSFRHLHRHARNDRVNRLAEGLQCWPCEQNRRVWDCSSLILFIQHCSVQLGLNVRLTKC